MWPFDSSSRAPKPAQGDNSFKRRIYLLATVSLSLSKGRIWDLGIGICDLRLGIWDLGFGPSTRLLVPRSRLRVTILLTGESFSCDCHPEFVEGRCHRSRLVLSCRFVAVSGESPSWMNTQKRAEDAPGIAAEIPCGVRRRSETAGIVAESPPVAPKCSG
jgi:hypothetical protein